MKNQSRTTKSNVQPVHRIRHGAVSASIWRQDTEKGPMFNVTFQRTYRDGDDWKNSSSFGRKDLLVLSFIAARAFEWISSQPKGTRQPSDSSKPDRDVPF
jgi:hypothetical protein